MTPYGARHTGFDSIKDQVQYGAESYVETIPIWNRVPYGSTKDLAGFHTALGSVP